MKVLKVIVNMDDADIPQWDIDCPSLPDWANWIVIKRSTGSVFAFQNRDDEGGAGMCLRTHLDMR